LIEPGEGIHFRSLRQNQAKGKTPRAD
jgi:hypothetical protein